MTCVKEIGSKDHPKHFLLESAEAVTVLSLLGHSCFILLMEAKLVTAEGVEPYTVILYTARLMTAPFPHETRTYAYLDSRS